MFTVLSKLNTRKYEFNQNIGWLVGETTNWINDENTGVLTKEEYDEFINNFVKADKNSTYLYSKSSYIYKKSRNKITKTPLPNWRWSFCNFNTTT